MLHRPAESATQSRLGHTIRMNLSKFPMLTTAALGLLISGNVASDENPAWKTATYMSAWGPCPPGESCGSWWLMDRATHSVERRGRGAKPAHKLSDQEWVRLEELVRAARQQASTCPSPPTDVFDTMYFVDDDGTKSNVEVTGCVFDRRDNAAKTLSGWLNHL